MNEIITFSSYIHYLCHDNYMGKNLQSGRVVISDSFFY